MRSGAPGSQEFRVGPWTERRRGREAGGPWMESSGSLYWRAREAPRVSAHLSPGVAASCRWKCWHGNRCTRVPAYGAAWVC